MFSRSVPNGDSSSKSVQSAKSSAPLPRKDLEDSRTLLREVQYFIDSHEWVELQDKRRFLVVWGAYEKEVANLMGKTRWQRIIDFRGRKKTNLILEQCVELKRHLEDLSTARARERMTELTPGLLDQVNQLTSGYVENPSKEELDEETETAFFSVVSSTHYNAQTRTLVIHPDVVVGSNGWSTCDEEMPLINPKVYPIPDKELERLLEIEMRKL
ncbi:hypothetical protein FRB94_013491 [Tulasnella sp. JGI-2019a]|nr:hypothetical protein FRB94_013491 [Tulasnella sp. JGI-2019a]KAG9026093.1 hypothetical protein FRB95_009400 [Tulasnella sp. JGI-2019a]